MIVHWGKQRRWTQINLPLPPLWLALPLQKATSFRNHIKKVSPILLFTEIIRLSCQCAYILWRASSSHRCLSMHKFNACRQTNNFDYNLKLRMNPYSIKKSEVHWQWLCKVLARLLVIVGNEGEQGPSPSWFACGDASELSLLVKSETNDSRSLCLDNHLLVKPFIKHSIATLKPPLSKLDISLWH